MTARPTRIALLVAAALACCCGEEITPSDGGSDASRDARPALDATEDAPTEDAPTDAITDAPRETDSGVRTGFTLEVHSDEACAPWPATVGALARELPADTTPRQLWYWNAEDDPVVLGSDVIGSSLNGDVAVALDGSIRMLIGAAADHLVAVDRGGSARWVAPIGAPVGSGPPVLAIAPSGETFVLTDAHALVAIDAGGIVRPLPFSSGPGDNPSLAIAPSGRLYVVGRDSITATCAGRTRVWTLTVPSDFIPTDPLVAPDGSIYVGDALPLGGGATIRLTPAGEVAERISAFAVESTVGVTVLSIAGTTRMLCGIVDASAERADFCDLVAGGATWRVPIPAGIGGAALLDPTGTVWVQDRTAPTSVALERYRDEMRLWRETGRGFPFEGLTWTSTGDLLGQPNGEEPLDGIEVIDATTGRVRWSLDAVRPDASTIYVLSLGLDPTGRAYVSSGGGEIVALQTDVLPSGEGTCSNYRCDPRRSRSMTNAP